MFWIYIPPIILVAALAALVVMLGRKSANIKKMKDFQPQSGIDVEKTDWKSRIDLIDRKILHILEIFLNFLKFAFKKTEQTVSVWVAKLRARRNGKRLEDISLDEDPEEINEAKILQEIEKTEELSMNKKNISYAESEVVVRRKIVEDPVIIPKKEPLPENKVQEAALIYRIAENPRDIEAYREIGDYYMGIGNIKDAKESFKMVLKLRPRDLKAKSSLREIEMKMRLGN